MSTQYYSSIPMNPEYRAFIDSKMNQKGVFLIRAKVDTYTMGSESAENKVRYYISKYMPHNIQEENNMLLDRLNQYSRRR